MEHGQAFQHAQVGLAIMIMYIVVYCAPLFQTLVKDVQPWRI